MTKMVCSVFKNGCPFFMRDYPGEGTAPTWTDTTRKKAEPCLFIEGGCPVRLDVFQYALKKVEQDD